MRSNSPKMSLSDNSNLVLVLNQNGNGQPIIGNVLYGPRDQQHADALVTHLKSKGMNVYPVVNADVHEQGGDVLVFTIPPTETFEASAEALFALMKNIGAAAADLPVENGNRQALAEIGSDNNVTWAAHAVGELLLPDSRMTSSAYAATGEKKPFTFRG